MFSNTCYAQNYAGIIGLDLIKKSIKIKNINKIFVMTKCVLMNYVNNTKHDLNATTHELTDTWSILSSRIN